MLKSICHNVYYNSFFVYLHRILKLVIMKKAKLVYVVTYNLEVLCVFSSRAKARAYCRKSIIDLDLLEYKFSILEFPIYD